MGPGPRRRCRDERRRTRRGVVLGHLRPAYGPAGNRLPGPSRPLDRLAVKVLLLLFEQGEARGIFRHYPRLGYCNRLQRQKRDQETWCVQGTVTLGTVSLWLREIKPANLAGRVVRPHRNSLAHRNPLGCHGESLCCFFWNPSRVTDSEHWYKVCWSETGSTE